MSEEILHESSDGYDEAFSSLLEEPAKEEPVQEESAKEEPKEVEPKEEVSPKTEEILHEIEFNKEVKKFNIDDLKNYASKGLEYESQKETFDKKEADLKDRFGDLYEIQKLALQDPEWGKWLRENYNNKVSGQDSNVDPGQFKNNPLVPLVQQLQDQLSTIKNEVRERFAEIDEEKTAQQRAQKEADLNSSIDSYKESYKHFDWEATNKNGENLTEQILNHGIENGIHSFKAAANDFLFDKHLQYMNSQAKEQAAKKIQEQNKKGLQGVTLQSTKHTTPAENLKNKSYDDLFKEGFQELGIDL